MYTFSFQSKSSLKELQFEKNERFVAFFFTECREGGKVNDKWGNVVSLLLQNFESSFVFGTCIQTNPCHPDKSDDGSVNVGLSVS